MKTSIFFLSIFWWRPFSPFPFSWFVGGVGRPQVHARQPVSLATGRSTISPTLHLYTRPVYRVYDRLARKVIFASKSPGPGIELETHRIMFYFYHYRLSTKSGTEILGAILSRGRAYTKNPKVPQLAKMFSHVQECFFLKLE